MKRWKSSIDHDCPWCMGFVCLQPPRYLCRKHEQESVRAYRAIRKAEKAARKPHVNN